MTVINETIESLKEKLNNKETTAKAVTEQALKQIKAVDGDVKAFLTVTEAEALKQAEALDAKGDFSAKLAGIPGSIKDNIVTKGVRTTAASKMLDNFTDPLYDATIIENLKAADAITLGKVNMDEFAMGSTTETSYYQKTKNPWNLDHTPGGSSGGSAASVAAGQVLFSLGSDTGGSIRQPASFNGIVGMKPTYGMVSRYGVVGFASSLDQVGPLTRTVKDNAYVLEAIAGHDENDMTSIQDDVADLTSDIDKGVAGLKIALPKQFLTDAVSKDMQETVAKTVETLKSLGATVEEVELPHAVYSPHVYAILSSGEAASSLARYDGVRFGHRAEDAENMIDMFKKSRTEGFGKEVKRRLLLGTTVLTGDWNQTYFRQAQKVRTLIREDFIKVFKDYDLILGPTTTGEAFALGEEISPEVAKMNDILTVPVNLAGLPGLSVPAGFGANNLPLGVQFIGKHRDEKTVYQAGYALEKANDLTGKLPQIGGQN